MRKILFGSAVAVLLLLAGRAAAEQPVSLGLQTSWADQMDFGVGARVVFDMSWLLGGLQTAAAFDYFFPSGLGVDTAYWEGNANFVYGIGDETRTLRPYLGTGFHLSRVEVSTRVLETDISARETQTGLNLVGGVTIATGRARPFIEARYCFKDSRQFVASMGVRF